MGSFIGSGFSAKKGKRKITGIIPDYISAMKSEFKFGIGKKTPLPAMQTLKYKSNWIGYSPTKEMLENKPTKQKGILGNFKFPKFKMSKRSIKKL